MKRRKVSRRILNKFLRFQYYRLFKNLYDKFYGDIAKELLESPSSPVEGEQDWVKKWSGFNLTPNPVYYRLFSRYDGKDVRIVPEDICRVHIEPCLNPQKFRKFYADKNSWDMLFPEGIFPPTVIRCMGGVILDKDYSRKADFNNKDLKQILDNFPSAKFVVKPTRDSNSSQGVDTINKINGKLVWGSDKTKEVTLEDIYSHVGDNFIVQPFLNQHKDMAKFCQSSVNPLRIVTYKSVKDDQIHIMKGGVLRVGYAGEETDGTHGNGKTIGINEDGTLKHEVLDYLGHVTTTFNSVDYTRTYQIPNFEKVRDLAVCVAKRVLHHRLLAFDIMIDEQGNPVVFEFNIDGFSMWLAQFVGEPAFGDYTDEIIDYCKAHQKDSELMYLY